MGELRTASDIVPKARQEGDMVYASIRGEIDLHNSPELRTELLDIVMKTSPKRLVLNLEQVPYMDSSAIAVMVELLQKIRRSGGKIILTNLQPRVQGLLEIARLNTIFPVVASEQDAANVT
jgi:anti-sigma B factor antagonist